MTKKKGKKIWLRYKGFNIKFKNLVKVQRFGLGGFRDKKKEKHQHKSTSIEDFKLGRYTFTNFESGVHEAYRIQNLTFTM